MAAASSSDGPRWPAGHEQSDLWKQYPELYQAIFVDHRHVFLSGIGGTGKSFTIGMIKRECDRLAVSCSLTATTGTAAHALGPGSSTIHRWSGIRLGDKPLDTILGWIKQRPDAKKRWKDVRILIIDEMSMLDSDTFELISAVGQHVRYTMRDHKRFAKDRESPPPFGGLQLIATADYLQLPPIKGAFAFESSLWPKMRFFNFRLIHPFRHPDPDHAALLARARIGQMTTEDEAKLRGRVAVYEEYRRKDRARELKEDIKPTRIYSLKRDVDAINLAELERLERRGHAL